MKKIYIKSSKVYKPFTENKIKKSPFTAKTRFKVKYKKFDKAIYAIDGVQFVYFGGCIN